MTMNSASGTSRQVKKAREAPAGHHLSPCVPVGYLRYDVLSTQSHKQQGQPYTIFVDISALRAVGIRLVAARARHLPDSANDRGRPRAGSVLPEVSDVPPPHSILIVTVAANSSSPLARQCLDHAHTTGRGPASAATSSATLTTWTWCRPASGPVRAGGHLRRALPHGDQGAIVASEDRLATIAP